VGFRGGDQILLPGDSNRGNNYTKSIFIDWEPGESSSMRRSCDLTAMCIEFDGTVVRFDRRAHVEFDAAFVRFTRRANGIRGYVRHEVDLHRLYKVSVDHLY
jgi:hypothetical protein